MNPRRYATPLAFKTSVEQRLRTAIIETTMDLNRRRQLFVFDRFLARLFEVLGTSVVLKGGMVIELRLATARTTKDIDLRMIGDPSDVLARLQHVGRVDLEDYLSFEIQTDARHPTIDAEGMTYQGLRYKAHCQLAGQAYGSPFGVDVAFAEPMHGPPDEIAGSNFLDFAGIEPTCFRVYPLETHIAEKLHALTVPRKRPNSRVKDLPDIALLASVRGIDSTVLLSAITKTFEHRATHPVPASVPTPPSTWSPIYKRIASNDNLRWKTMDEVTAAVKSFLDPVLTGATLQWQAEAWTWRAQERTPPQDES